MSVSWILNRHYTCSSTSSIEDSLVDRFVSGFSCSSNDEYHIEGEMGMPLPPFVAKFSGSLLKGHLLCVADEDGHVKLVDTRKTKDLSTIKEWSAHSNAVFDLAWVSDEPKLVTASGDQTARLWDIERAETIAIFRGHTCSLKSVAVQPDSNKVIVTGARDGNIMAWDTRCNRKNGFFNPMNTIAHAHALPVKEATTMSGKKRRTRRNSMFNADAKASVTSAIFQGSKTVISSGACDGTLKYWDMRKTYTNHKGNPIAFHVIPFPWKTNRTYGYSSLVIDSNMSRLFAACTNDIVYEYSTTNLSSKPVATYDGHKISSFYVKTTLSPDNRYLLCGSSDGNAYIWRTDKANSPPWVLKGHGGEVTSVAWSPGNEKIATCSDDNTFKVWRLFQKHENNSVDRCERLSREMEKSTNTKNIEEQTCRALQQRRLNPPLKLCIDKRITVSWTLHDIPIKIPVSKQQDQQFTPPVKTPDAVKNQDSPATSISDTPTAFNVTPTPTASEESGQTTPISTTTVTTTSTTPTIPTSSRSRSTRTPRSSRLFMESWLKSPTIGRVHPRRICTRKKDIMENEPVDLSVIQESSNEQIEVSRNDKKGNPNNYLEDKQNKNESNQDALDSSKRNVNTIPNADTDNVDSNNNLLKTTPQRITRSSRKQRKTPRSEDIKSFLVRSKRKRDEVENGGDIEKGTSILNSHVKKCLKMDKIDGCINENTERELHSFNEKVDKNKIISDIEKPKEKKLLQNSNISRIKDLLDYANEDMI